MRQGQGQVQGQPVEDEEVGGANSRPRTPRPLPQTGRGSGITGRRERRCPRCHTTYASGPEGLRLLCASRSRGARGNQQLGHPETRTSPRGERKGRPAPRHFSPAGAGGPPRGVRRPGAGLPVFSQAREGILGRRWLAARAGLRSGTPVWFFGSGKAVRTKSDPRSCISYGFLQGAGGICQ